MNYVQMYQIRQFALWLGCSALLAMLLASMPMAWASQTPNTSQSPYFYVSGAQPGVDALPLKQTDVEVTISGVIADVVIVQHYRNEGSKPIEAKYVFPGSTRAAVYAMSVRIGDRLITADIRERQQARIEYQEALNEGRTAALLEEHLPNIFQMNVANIMPGDDIRVEMHYTELLVPQNSIYQFVFPTVVGPRYNSPLAQTEQSHNTANAVSNPYFHAEEPNSALFNLNARIVSPVGVKEVTSSSHAILVNQSVSNKVTNIKMERGFNVSNRDFILDYRLAGDKIESGIMLYEGDEENFFLAMVEPPQRVSTEMMPARDYIFVVDISGSMDGFPLDTAKKLLRELLAGLRSHDTFNILLFSGSSETLSPKSVPATPENIEQAMRMMSTYYGSGSTELIPTLCSVYKLPKPAGLSRTIVVLTDGYVSVEGEAFNLIRNNLNKANLFAFGIGSSVNCYLIEGMARAGMGEPFIVTNEKDAKEQAQRLFEMIASPVLTNIKAQFDQLDVYDIEPVQLPDLLGQRPIVIFGKWWGNARGNIIIEGQSGEGAYRQVLPVTTVINRDTAALRYLWARHRIDTLMDLENLHGGSMYQDQITQLGLKYSLLTPYTSFIAVDRIVHNTTPGQTEQVNQPSPMPEGVSDYAVGSEVPSTPEPIAWGAMLFVGSALAMMARHQRRRNNRLTS